MSLKTRGDQSRIQITSLGGILKKKIGRSRGSKQESKTEVKRKRSYNGNETNCYSWSIDPGFGLKSLFTLHYFGLIQRSKQKLKVPHFKRLSQICLRQSHKKTKKYQMMSALKISHTKGIPTKIKKNTQHEGCRIVCFLVLCIHISVLLIF